MFKSDIKTIGGAWVAPLVKRPTLGWAQVIVLCGEFA